MSVIAYSRLIDALDAHGYTGRVSGTHAQYQCPGHEDRTPSLSIDDRPDTVVVHCHGPCGKDTLRVLEPIGLGYSDLFDEPARGKGWKTSTLRKVGATVNGDGRINLGGVRYLPGGDPKTLAVKGAKRDLFPDPADVPGPILYVVEGEPDAMTATNIGLPAVAIPGAGKWNPAWAERLTKGRERVVILPDCDETGRKAAEKVAASIAEHGTHYCILDLAPERDDGYDLSDYCSDATTDEDRVEVRRVIEAAAAALATPPVVEVIDTAALLEEIAAFLKRFVVLPSEESCDLLALWTIHTWAFDAAFATPYLRITSAAPGSGKTLLLEVLAATTRRGWHAINPSTAVLYRKIDKVKPTLLLDEMDNYPLDDRREALSVLNAGYKRGAQVDRCKENGDLEAFSAWCPKAYAGLDKRALVDTLLSRSITIRLDAKLASEKTEMWIAPIVDPLAEDLRGRCEQWAAGQDMTALALERPTLPACLVNRAAEVWWALLTLAEHAGGDWPARAARAAEVLTTGGDAIDDKPDQEMLLEDIRRAFGSESVIATAELLAKLNALEESPWGARRRGEGLDSRGLAQMLRPFRVKPRTVRVGEHTPRGYRLDQFEDAFARNLTSPSESATSATSATSRPQPRADVADVADVADKPGGAHEVEEVPGGWTMDDIARLEAEHGRSA